MSEIICAGYVRRAIPSRRAAVDKHRRGRAWEAGRPVNARGYKKPPPRDSRKRYDSGTRKVSPAHLSSRDSFIGARQDLAPFHAEPKGPRSAVARASKGLHPPPFLDELLETSFHDGAVTEAKFGLFRRRPAKSHESGFHRSGEDTTRFRHCRARLSPSSGFRESRWRSFYLICT